MKFFWFKQYLLLCTIIFLISCDQQKEKMHSASIKDGTAKVSGKIVDYLGDKSKGIFVYMTICRPITGENVQCQIPVDEFGNFSTEVEIETSLTVCGLYSDINPFRSLLIALEEGKETKIEIAYNADNNIEKVEIRSNYKLPQNDMSYAFDVISKMIDYRSGKPREQFYDKDSEYFINHAENVLEERLKIVNSDLYLSDNTKKIIAKEFSIFLINAHFLDYREEMLINYQNIQGEKNSDSLQFQEPDKSYYAFLRKMDLNNPLYLYCFSFPEFSQKILQNETLNIPNIGEMSIDDWLRDVKIIISDCVGFDDGLFYNVLIGNAYARQFKNELRPLSERQIENIKKHFKGGEIEKILLRKNNKIVELAKYKSDITVNKVPKVAKEELINAIVSKYKDKVVIVDFWATWCAPCLTAMKEFRDVKEELKGKDVAFVYISNTSSPKKLWEEVIKGIGGEHYYLTEEQWEYLLNNLNFSGVPSYLLYDRNGKLKNKFTGYPGNDKMKTWINDLLINE